LGHELLVSEVANTVLKGKMVGGNIPTVAEVTQGEVVKFASNACKIMGEAGVTVRLLSPTMCVRGVMIEACQALGPSSILG